MLSTDHEFLKLYIMIDCWFVVSLEKYKIYIGIFVAGASLVK